MLFELRNYIKKHNTVSIMQIAREFRVDSQALQPMLDFWVKKGVVKIYNSPVNCKSVCGGCSQKDVNLYYSWIN